MLEIKKSNSITIKDKAMEEIKESKEILVELLRMLIYGLKNNDDFKMYH